MNERLKELAEQAGAEFIDASKDYFGDYHPAGVLTDRIDLQKFAESIVRECIERVRNQCIHVRDSTIEGRPNPFYPDLRVRTEREQGIVECGIKSVIALEELIQESTDRWHKENILGDED